MSCRVVSVGTAYPWRCHRGWGMGTSRSTLHRGGSPRKERGEQIRQPLDQLPTTGVLLLHDSRGSPSELYHSRFPLSSYLHTIEFPPMRAATSKISCERTGKAGADRGTLYPAHLAALRAAGSP